MHSDGAPVSRRPGELQPIAGEATTVRVAASANSVTGMRKGLAE